MPTYQYRCNDCPDDFEVVQKFSDAALSSCPVCDGPVRKVFSAVGVVFKGSGFYATDNRTKGGKQAAASAPSGDSGSSASTPSSTPAPAAAAATSAAPSTSSA